MFFLRPDIIFNAVPHVLRNFQGVTQRIEVAALHKVINIDSRAAEEVKFQRLFLIFNALRQPLRIKRAINRLLNQLFTRGTNTRFLHTAFNRFTLVTIDVTIAFGGKHQRRNQSLGTLINRRGALPKLRIVTMGFADALFVFVPQHRTRCRTAANDQRVFAILCQQLTRRTVCHQQASQAAQRTGRQHLAQPFDSAFTTAAAVT